MTSTPTQASGDPDTLFREGLDQFAEITDPQAFTRGIALVEQAAQGGHAEALAMLATIEAIGAGRPQNFEKALDFLAQAAGRGSGFARDQLRVLSGRGDAEDEADWQQLRSAVDLQRLFAVPEKQSISDEPRIRAIPGFASAAECRWIVERARPKMAPAMIWDEQRREGRLDPSRNNSALELRLADMDVVTELVRARIAVATRLPEPIYETPQVLHYSVGQEFRPHYDFLDPAKPGHAADIAHRGQRIATFLVYLNGGFEGGETRFPNAGHSFSGQEGDALFWANVRRDNSPDPLTLHAGLPPTQGEKWILSQWIRDRTPGVPTRG